MNPASGFLNKNTLGYDSHISVFNLLEKGTLMKKFIGLMLTGVAVAAVIAVVLSGAMKDGGGAPIPEKASIFLLGSGMIGLAGYGRRKFFKE